MSPFSFFNTGNKPKHAEQPPAKPENQGQSTEETDLPETVDFGSLFAEEVSEGEDNPSKPVSIAELVGRKESLSQLASQYDFAKMVNKDTMDKIRSGDSDAIVQAMGNIAKAAYTAALRDNAQLIDHSSSSSFELSQKMSSKAMEKLIKDQDFVRQNELFSDSMFAPMVGVVKGQLKKKYPQKSDQWVAEQVQDYFKAMAEKVKPSSVASEDTPKRINFAQLLNLPETRNA